MIIAITTARRRNSGINNFVPAFSPIRFAWCLRCSKASTISIRSVSLKFLEPIFIFEDERGLLILLVRDGFKQVNYITAKKNYIRGGLFHKFNREAFFVISGKFDLDISDLEKEVQEKHTISTEEFFEIQTTFLQVQ